MTADTTPSPSLVAALTHVAQWCESIGGLDMDEIVADGGITAGMVVSQEAREQARRARAALTVDTSDRVGEATADWVPTVGEEVRTTEAFNEKYSEWRDVPLFVAGVSAERGRGNRFNVTVTEQWPLERGSDLTDGFYVGDGAPNDLTRLAASPTPLAGSGNEPASDPCKVPDGERARDLADAKAWLCKRWYQEHPNAQHVIQLADYASHLRVTASSTDAPARVGEGERERAREVAASFWDRFDTDSHRQYADAIRAGERDDCEAVQVALLAATTPTNTTPADTAPVGETLESIIAWGDETFGFCSAERAVERGDEERAEADLETPGTAEHAVEIADTIICYLRVPGILDAINAKMAKNRARKWNVRPDGTGYHVKDHTSSSGKGGDQ